MADDPELVEGNALVDRHDDLNACGPGGFRHRSESQGVQHFADDGGGFHNARLFLARRVQIDHPFAREGAPDIMQGRMELQGGKVAEPQQLGQPVQHNIMDAVLLGRLDELGQRIGSVFLVKNSPGTPCG